DPYPSFRQHLIQTRIASNDDLEEIERKFEGMIDDAVEYALSSPYPDLAEFRKDVYASEVVE
ncbi:MAG: hypothetical protein RLP02_09005, partial [Coleofasciculus sp. C2-GNP5-27]